MTLQCSRCTSKFYAIKNTGVLTIVILRRYNHLCPGLNAVTNFANFTIFRFRFKFNKFLRFFVKLYKIYKNPLPERFFGTLCRNLQFYANRPASAGLQILQNLQNLRFFNKPLRNLRFLHFFVMQIPPTCADLRILQNLRFFAVNNKTQKDR